MCCNMCAAFYCPAAETASYVCLFYNTVLVLVVSFVALFCFLLCKHQALINLFMPYYFINSGTKRYVFCERLGKAQDFASFYSQLFCLSWTASLIMMHNSDSDFKTTIQCFKIFQTTLKTT